MTNDEIIASARRKNLVEYFQACGYTLQKKGSEFYVSEIKGLTINPNSGAWYHHYQRAGGYNAIDCLCKVFDMDFKQAVYALTGEALQSGQQKQNGWFKKKEAPAPAPKPVTAATVSPKREVAMPAKADADAPLFAYLHKTRGIPYDVIKEFKDAGLLYQTNRKFGNGFKANAVFVHRDRDSNPVGGEVQGLDPVHRFKGMVAGTGDSAFQFVPVPARDGKLKRAYVFESSIDLMSFYTMFRKELKLEGVAFISLAGLKPTVPKRLQEQGVEIISCVDNDTAGQSFEVDNGFKRSEFVKDHLDARGLKDWNDLLRNPNARPEPARTFSPVNERYSVRSMMH